VDVTINGMVHELPARTALDQAVALITAARTGVAAAVNGEVVPAAAWPSRELASGDEVEVLTAVQGG
jgi:sulfur carrier protein